MREATIVAASDYVSGELREYIGTFDREIAQFSQPSQLRSMISLERVKLFPHAKSGLPYFGLDFNCSWDCEHGFGVVLWGLTALAVGGSDVFQENCPIEDHGGEI